jgi:glycerol uptake facilitator-like aquaporin
MTIYVAEALGAMLLLATVVGSGILAERICGGNAGLALLANAAATACALYVLIAGLGRISGAHFNPVVTLVEAASGRLPRGLVPGYLAAQLCGALLGVALAHAMFGLDIIQHAQHVRSSHGELIGEVVATFGLVLVIALVGRAKPDAIPAAVASYIFAAYWFTSSTSFANPAVTLARCFTDTFAGIRGADAAPFIAAQFVGGAIGALAARALAKEAS